MILRLRRIVIGRAKSIHTKATETSVESCRDISRLLSNGGKWDALTAGFGSIGLTDSLVERVLLNLKEPSDAKKALLFFHWSSTHKSFQHGLRSYCIAIHILVRAGLLIDARALLESAVKKNFETSTTSSSSSSSDSTLLVDALLTTYEEAVSGPRVFDLLVQMYAKMRMIEHAFDACCQLVDRGFSISLMSFNTLLRVAQKSDRDDVAWKVYEYMIEKRVYPDRNSIEIMTNVMCKQGALQKMIDVLDKIHGKRCTPGVIVNTALGFRIFEENEVEHGSVLLKRLLQKNMILDGVVYSLIVFARCKMGEFEQAYEVYDEMLKRGCGSNAFVYTCFIGAHCKSGRIDEATKFMHEMRLRGFKPYRETYSYLIEGCSMMGRLEECLNLFEEMNKQGFVPDCDACNQMIGKLCEGGEVEKANEILTVLLDKGFKANEVTYMKLMEGFGAVGNVGEIMKLYYEMQHCGIHPDPMVYEPLIKSLYKCGKLKEAEKLLNAMGSRKPYL
ncbi:hypothetical protein J5N97_007378 [Dioscorea zingiberensis]|uniref:Pentatricopeptide repeat-containing protein n=1 Tax=Dioscorea zingiberensis TaxID=325984 RepID=A0A9D5DEU8_9LILI|nr:hypothetical protein J5N97_007378 [Dioscorea zingiberensis]